MSEGGVSVGADYSDRKYTVTFTVDGKVISTVTAKYGEEIAPPPAPEKAPDQKYRYVFIDWFPEITKVTSDTVYEARYMSIELPPKDNSGLQISKGALRIIMNIGFLAFYLGVVALPVLSVAAVKTVLRIRRKSKSVKSKESS
jgi:hypothetical protein